MVELKEKPLVALVVNKVFIECFYHNNSITRLEHLISDILNIDYEKVKGNIELLPRDQKQDNLMNALTQVDFLCTLNGKKIGIEVNRSEVPGLFKRNLVYNSKVLGSMYKKGMKYKDIDLAIQINLTNFKCEQSSLLKKYMVLDTDGEGVVFADNLIIYNVDMTKALDKNYELKPGEEKIALWSKLFNAKDSCTFAQICDKLFTEEESKEFVKIMEEISSEEEIIRLDEDPDAGLRSLEDAIISEANEKGLQQGIEQKELEIAKKMLENNLDIETISKCTSLSKEEINKLKN